MKNVSILGSTGSIGIQTIDVIRNLKEYKIIGLAANSNIDMLERQINEFKPKIVAVYDEKSAKELKERVGTKTKIVHGMNGLIEVAVQSENNLVVISVVGIIGLLPTIEAIKNKVEVAIATKEVIVAAGEFVVKTAKENNVNLIPIDSEHCAIMQCLSMGYKDKISKIILTASGGPFRGKSLEELRNVTVEEALNHPNWKMGKKISIDSATLMNKGMEVIEAKWFFDVGLDKIEVVIHPQSIIHSMVEYIDGSIIAQLGVVDMRLPIQYALTYPDIQYSNNIKRLNLFDKELTFEKPDYNTFRLLRLAYDALNIGGTMPTVLNSSNEAAVELFLNNKIGFIEIQYIVEECMKKHSVIGSPSLEDILNADLWAKEFVKEMVN